MIPEEFEMLQDNGTPNNRSTKFSIKVIVETDEEIKWKEHDPSKGRAELLITSDMAHSVKEDVFSFVAEELKTTLKNFNDLLRDYL